MPLIHMVPVVEGMTRDKLAQRLQTGWILVGRQAVALSNEILVPGDPVTATGIVDMDVWVLPEPTIPAGVVASILAQEYTAGEDDTRSKALLLDDIARALFGMGIDLVVERVASAAETEGGSKQ